MTPGNDNRPPGPGRPLQPGQRVALLADPARPPATVLRVGRVYATVRTDDGLARPARISTLRLIGDADAA